MLENIKSKIKLNFFLKTFISTVLISISLNVHASFIESSIGAAVINDATATYYNPAALTLLKKSQAISLNSFGSGNSRFKGQFSQAPSNLVLSGQSNANSNYFLPSVYFAVPTSDKITLGLAIVSNYLNRDIDDNSVLRYAQSSNSIQNYDFVPGMGIRFNKFFSMGAGINFSYADFVLRPITGFPSINVPDSRSRNECKGTGLGGDGGILLQPTTTTLIGFNYRSAITYRLSGTSVFEGNPKLVSHRYSYAFWTPARSVLSISQFITPSFGLITTIQRIQWSIFKNVKIHGIATQIGTQSVIVDGIIPYHLNNSWVLTLGTHYRVNPKWVMRFATSYNQSSGNSHYQIANGNSVIAGVSSGYELFKNLTIDASYAHAFMQDASIHINNARSRINGVNSGSVNSVSVKFILTA